ncbi:MAG: alkaline phosphatase family protein, partial [Caldilineaceae bacterium]|nr:alkaline phosphatase family protein [Caldilineaceae bacterium]
MAANPNLTLFVMIDGLRPDALARCDCPTLTGLMERGAFSLQARSVMPSVTLPCHMSIFHS